MKDLSDLYFYKGKYRTDEGLKRALIKDKIVWTSPKQNYYCYEDYTEYCYPYDMMFDYASDYEWCSKEELKHFRSWLNKMIKEGKITICNCMFYHCDENDGIGTCDWWDTREAIMDCMDRLDPKYPDDFIETSENSVEEYCQTLSEDDFKKFEELSEDKQYKIAMSWRIEMYNNYKKVLESNNEKTN